MKGRVWKDERVLDVRKPESRPRKRGTTFPGQQRPQEPLPDVLMTGPART